LAGDAETLEWTYIRKDRSKIPVQLTVTAIYNDQKKISGFLGIAKDITQEKLASQTLQLAMQKAESANRSKSEFVANMSHEIRTPMNAVLGMVHLLSTTELSIEQKKYLEMIRTSGQSLLAILNDILDFSKIEAGRMELAPVHFRLADVMNAVATLMSVYAGEKDLELAIGMEANVPHHFFGDALRIQQILINLVGNAIKFTGQGEVSIFVEQVERQGNTSVLRFWVRDTGIGMSEEQQLRLFSPFTQADNSTTRRFGGTGLGLSICKQLVELMGGEIQVRSTAESGSEFCIKLPLTIDLEKADIREHRNELKNLNILVVDDNQTSRHYLRKTIEAWRWHADTVSSGQQAMDQLLTASTSEGAPPKYDVILMDWEMPDLDGLQTMQTLRTQMGKCCPPVIIMVGAFGRVKLMEQAGIADADAILQKPVTTSDLFDAMQSCLVHDSENQSGANNKTALFELRQKKSQTQLDGVTILLVEDNPLNQIVARGILEKAGARLHIVNNGKEAVDHLQTNAANYDLILMDVQMPVMDGFTATKIIRNQLQLKLPVIAMSAGVMESEKADCTKAGMDDFIGKPIDTDLLFSTILRHLQHKKNPVHAPLVNTDSPDTIDANSASPTNSNVADEQFFNPERLTGLRDINPVAYKTLLGLVKNIIDRSPAQLQQVRQDWEAARYTEAARLLHTMRGSVGILGAHQFARLSLELENAVLSPTPEDITKLLDETQSALNHTIIAASTWLAEQ
jgi:signal transduction histidine kinase/CheY-like chemotaxis protein